MQVDVNDLIKCTQEQADGLLKEAAAWRARALGLARENDALKARVYESEKVKEGTPCTPA